MCVVHFPNNLATKSFQDVFKCVIPILPRAKTAVFIRKGKYKLTFDNQIDEDAPRPDGETGYSSHASGDSDAPFMVAPSPTDPNKPKGDAENRYTFVAIVSHRDAINGRNIKQPAAIYLTDKYDQCRMISSKMTREILKWIKVRAGIIKE